MANSSGWGDGAANNNVGWGQGANNAIGWGSSHATSWAGATDIVGLTTDADAQAFITAAAITDATQQSAIDTLVKGLKTDGVWTKMKAIYPFVGGTATTHKYNLKDPRDLDAAFRLVFNGGWTHSSTGATPNGVNGYADTYLAPSGNLAQNDSHASVYSRTNSLILNQMDLGCGYTGNNADLYLSCYYSSTLGAISNINGSSYGGNASNTNSLGFFLSQRTTSTSTTIYQNNTAIKTHSQISTTPSALSINLARNTTSEYGARQLAFVTFGSSFTTTERTNLYTRVQAFQTALSRNV
jgi:hypothetical protein